MIGQKGFPVIYGGIEKHVHDLSVRLAAKGHQVTVYSRTWYTGKSGTDMVEGVERVHTPTIKTKHLDAITHVCTATLHALFRRYDIIHYHGVGPALLAWIPQLFSPKTKIVITLHSLDRFHQKWSWFARTMLKLGERAAYAFADETITVSENLTHYMQEKYQVQTTYIPNGVGMSRKITTDDHIKSFGLKADSYIVMISRLVPHKGAHVLVEAFKEFKRRHKEDHTVQSLKLAIVGGAAYTDEYVRKLHIAAGSLNDIIFTDFQSGMALDELYAHARLLIHPSLNEGLPMTVLQGMSYGIPVLLSSIPEHREIITDPRIFFKENDVESLVNCLEEFMRLTKEERINMGRKNKAIIHEKYDWEHIVEKTEHVYTSRTLVSTSIPSANHS